MFGFFEGHIPGTNTGHERDLRDNNTITIHKSQIVRKSVHKINPLIGNNWDNLFNAYDILITFFTRQGQENVVIRLVFWFVQDNKSE